VIAEVNVGGRREHGESREEPAVGAAERVEDAGGIWADVC
jgi:hypothetical protein